MVKVSIGTQLPAEVKAEAQRRAAEERRSLANYLEMLIVRDAQAHPAAVPAKKPQVSRAVKAKAKPKASSG
jgi:hypothetical protein